MTLQEYNLDKTYYEKLYMDIAGYLRHICDDELFHRKRIEKILGRKLRYYEVVHHIDGNKRNNLKENLLPCSRARHRAIHELQFEKYNDWNKPLPWLLK